MEFSILLPVSEHQVIALAQQLTPNGKRKLLQNLIPGMDALDRLVDYGDQRIRAISASRNIDWDGLSDDERMRVLDEMLHEDQHG